MKQDNFSLDTFRTSNCLQISYVISLLQSLYHMAGETIHIVKFFLIKDKTSGVTLSKREVAKGEKVKRKQLTPKNVKQYVLKDMKETENTAQNTARNWNKTTVPKKLQRMTNHREQTEPEDPKTPVLYMWSI